MQSPAQTVLRRHLPSKASTYEFVYHSGAARVNELLRTLCYFFNHAFGEMWVCLASDSRPTTPRRDCFTPETWHPDKSPSSHSSVSRGSES